MGETPVQARPGEALVWTDWACRGNPGPGGWAAIVVPPGGGEAVEHAGSAADTTNNRMEFTAAIEGLRRLPAGSHACVVTDSLLLLKSMTVWVAGWKRRGWRTAGGAPVQGPRPDRGARVRARAPRRGALALGARPRDWHRARANKALNERADRLAVAASHAVAG
jgi:ribonuclease HI